MIVICILDFKNNTPFSEETNFFQQAVYYLDESLFLSRDVGVHYWLLSSVGIGWPVSRARSKTKASTSSLNFSIAIVNLSASDSDSAEGLGKELGIGID